MSDFWEGYEPEPTRPAHVIRDELTEPLGCVVVRPLVANRATPPAAQRQWVGLTDEEFEDIELGCRSTSSGKIEAMQKVEAKLKEKNGLHRQHVIDGSPCWCEPETSYTDPETGASVVVHKEPQ